MGGTGSASTSAGGTSGSPSTVMSPATIPTWASSMLKSASSGGPSANLGFPSSSMAPPTTVGGNQGQTGPSAGNTAAGFQSAPLPTGNAGIPTIGGRAPPPVAAPAAGAAAPAAPAAPAADPNAQVFVYTQPSWGYADDWQHNGPTPYQDAGVFSAKGPVPDPNNTTFGRGWGPAVSIGSDPYNANSVTEAGQKAVAGMKAGDAITTEQAATMPHMSKALYDSNMAAYGNPYGPAVDTQNREYYNHLLQLNGLGGWADMQQHGSG